MNVAPRHLVTDRDQRTPSLARGVALPLGYWTTVSLVLATVIIQHGLAPFRASSTAYFTARIGAYTSAMGSILMIVAFAAAAALGTRAALAWLQIRGDYRDALVVGASAFWVLGSYALVGLIAFIALSPRPLPPALFSSAARYAYALTMQPPLGALQRYRWLAAGGAVGAMIVSAWRRFRCSPIDAALIVGIALGVVCGIAYLLHALVTAFAIVS